MMRFAVPTHDRDVVQNYLDGTLVTGQNSSDH